MKRYRKEDSDKLEVGQVFYTKRFVLTVDRALCKGCDICKLVCPREAITIRPAVTGPDGKSLVPVIDVDEEKCDFHGICAVACPFSAIKISINGNGEIPAVVKGVFPVLTRDIDIDSSKCAESCVKCEEKCPLGIISVTRSGQDSAPDISVDKELCAGCLICREECPTDAVKVTKFIEGSIQIDNELCPEGCRKCLDVCPLNALYTDDDNRIGVRETACIYCGACRNVCPEAEALVIERTRIRHSPIESGAWNKGLERMTSTSALNKELTTSRIDKIRAAATGAWNEE